MIQAGVGFLIEFGQYKHSLWKGAQNQVGIDAVVIPFASGWISNYWNIGTILLLTKFYL